MSFSYYRSLTVDHTKVPNTDQTNFPVLVSITTQTYIKTAANGGHVQNTSGYDIGFYSDSALSTKLNWEVEFYDGTAGSLVAWVNIASLSHTTDTVFYIAYGDATISTFQGNVAATWDANYLGIWHLADGTTLNLANSVGTNTATNHSATATTGQIDGGIAVTTSIYADTGYTPSSITGFTLSAWVKQTTSQTAGFPFSARDSNGNNGIFMLYENGVGAEVGFTNGGNLTRKQVNVNISTATWHYVVGVHTATSTLVTLYIDGTSTGFQSNSGASNPGNAGAFVIGRDGVNTTPNGFGGSIDEIRFSNSTRASDWVVTEYNNQNSPTTFLSTGTEVTTTIVTTQTISGKGRIQITTTQTITGKSRITVSTLQPLTGKSRVRITSTQTISGKSSIMNVTLQTITGKGRVTNTSSKTLTGKGRIGLLTSKTLTGLGRIQVNVSQTLSGKTRIQLSTLRTITGKASLLRTTLQTITGHSRIQLNTSRTISGKGRIFSQGPVSPKRKFLVQIDTRSYRVPIPKLPSVLV